MCTTRMYATLLGIHLQPLRRHEQNVSPKKVYFANLRLASTDTCVYYAHLRLVVISDLYDAASSG